LKPILKSVTQSLSLRVLPTDRFKAGMLSLSAVLPITAETTPMTSLLLSVLLRGTEKYPTLEAINRRLDYLFGTELTIRNFYRGDAQVIGFSAELLDVAYLAGEDPTREILDVVDQILFHPLLDENGYLTEKYVESEKKLQCDSIRSIKNNPRVYAAERIRALLYEGQPCGVPAYGTEQAIMAITPEVLTAHWRNLVKNLTLDCFYIGSMDTDRLAEHLSATLGTSLTASHTAYPTVCSSVPLPKAPRTVSETIEAGQSHLLLAYRSSLTLNDARHAACMVFNEMLGASPVSRLFVYVREKLSLCYSCSSSYRPMKGTLQIACGLHRDNREVAEAEIKKQMEDLICGSFSDAELEAAKKSLRHFLRQSEDSPAALESFYYNRALTQNETTLDDLRRAIEAVTREDVTEVARAFSLHTVYFLEGTLNEEDDVDEED